MCILTGWDFHDDLPHTLCSFLKVLCACGWRKQLIANWVVMCKNGLILFSNTSEKQWKQDFFFLIFFRCLTKIFSCSFSCAAYWILYIYVLCWSWVGRPVACSRLTFWEVTQTPNSNWRVGFNILKQNEIKEFVAYRRLTYIIQCIFYCISLKLWKEGTTTNMMSWLKMNNTYAWLKVC